MPVPPEYQRARDDFYRFLLDARDTAGLATTHQAFTMVQGVLQTFRRRLPLPDAIRFANVLPPVLRALFISDWDPDAAPQPYSSREAMTLEVRALRADHNFAPDTAIFDVAEALRRHVDTDLLHQVLTRLPVGAVEFWRIRNPGKGE